MSNIPLEQGDFERQVKFDFLRATESAALNTPQWLGKGQKEKADEAACDAIRGTLDVVNICGEVVIGEIDLSDPRGSLTPWCPIPKTPRREPAGV